MRLSWELGQNREQARKLLEKITFEAGKERIGRGLKIQRKDKDSEALKNKE